jgi:hypothetical protein
VCAIAEQGMQERMNRVDMVLSSFSRNRAGTEFPWILTEKKRGRLEEEGRVTEFQL